MKVCKKCLLLEAGENVTFSELQQYIKSLDKSLIVSEEVYSERIKNCLSCDMLISGMCLKCGCYVEVRGRLKDKECPNEDNKRW